ncbi:methionine gamma-lyase family protein [Alkalicoccus luteus]|uniref:Cystathionine beta-lyase family protein involved in aluminum resistance n=1 Tax=Alkalicoccus luteus TaxID=1237094 RepID=A0A969PRM2_9BACI|nr:hypothetical protein [Alkalicoccus luteus]
MMERTDIHTMSDAVHRSLMERFFTIGQTVEYNQRRVLNAFREAEVSDYHFAPSTGYGYDDSGRDKLENIYAEVFAAESALVRGQFVSGTHAISTALFGVLRPGDELLYITGRPYDTLEEVIGLKGEAGNGALKDYGITYKEVELKNGNIDVEEVLNQITDNTKVIGIQRSRGYGNRPSITIDAMEEAIHSLKAVHPGLIVFVDNCYGEFVETREPGHAGADLTAGSLIKNPGGGLALTGGYICGRKDLVIKCANRLAAPGIGAEGGATTGVLHGMFQGFFLAPHVVGEALKGAVFTAAMLEEAGMSVEPKASEERTDLIQAVHFNSAEEMTAFCQTIQKFSPVDSHVTPYPSPMPGYSDDVIMAAGAFIQGASIELSADGPLRPPYRAYVQGGLTFEHVKTAVTEAVSAALTGVISRK